MNNNSLKPSQALKRVCFEFDTYVKINTQLKDHKEILGVASGLIVLEHLMGSLPSSYVTVTLIKSLVKSFKESPRQLKFIPFHRFEDNEVFQSSVILKTLIETPMIRPDQTVVENDISRMISLGKIGRIRGSLEYSSRFKMRSYDIKKIEYLFDEGFCSLERMKNLPKMASTIKKLESVARGEFSYQDLLNTIGVSPDEFNIEEERYEEDKLELDTEGEKQVPSYEEAVSFPVLPSNLIYPDLASLKASKTTKETPKSGKSGFLKALEFSKKLI